MPQLFLFVDEALDISYLTQGHMRDRAELRSRPAAPHSQLSTPSSLKHGPFQAKNFVEMHFIRISELMALITWIENLSATKKGD